MCDDFASGTPAVSGLSVGMGRVSRSENKVELAFSDLGTRWREVQ